MVVKVCFVLFWSENLLLLLVSIVLLDCKVDGKSHVSEWNSVHNLCIR